MIRNEEDKVWVTISRNIQLEDYENYKLEAGYSRTKKEGDDAMNLIEEAELELSQFVIEKTEEIREEYEQQTKSNRRKRK